MLLFFFFNPLSKWWSLSKKNESFLLRCFSKKIKIKIKKIPSFSKKKKKIFQNQKLFSLKSEIYGFISKKYMFSKKIFTKLKENVFSNIGVVKRKKKEGFPSLFSKRNPEFLPKKKKKKLFSRDLRFNPCLHQKPQILVLSLTHVLKKPKKE